MSEDNDQPLEVLPPSAIMALERAQIDCQVATAHAYPRSLEQFKKRALSMCTLDEDTADSCIYVRPVGKEQNEKGQWVEKYAEGPSIRLAEIVAASYGNLRVAARIVEQTERFVRCEGVAHDLESNFAGKSECVESTVNKKGEPYSERQRALVAKVCLSKAFRDATFRVVPRALCKPAFEAAKKVAAGQGKPLVERRKKARAWVGTLKIDESRVFAAMGVGGWDEITDDHLIKLTGLKTAMADGDETIDSAFPPVQGQQSGAHTPTPTPHQQATQGSQKPAEAPKAPPAVVEQPGGQTPQAPAKAQEPAPSQQTITPAQPENVVQMPATTATTPQEGGDDGDLGPQTQAPAAPAAPVETDPAWDDKEGDSESIKSVNLLMRQSNVTYGAFKAWSEKMKLKKPNQTHRDLADAKLLRIASNFHSILPEIRKEEKPEPPTP